MRAVMIILILGIITFGFLAWKLSQPVVVPFPSIELEQIDLEDGIPIRNYRQLDPPYEGKG